MRMELACFLSATTTVLCNWKYGALAGDGMDQDGDYSILAVDLLAGRQAGSRRDRQTDRQASVQFIRLMNCIKRRKSESAAAACLPATVECCGYSLWQNGRYICG